MKEFLKMMRQYASPYKGYLAGAVFLNILSAIFNIFSFTVLVPLLNILFKVNSEVEAYEFIPWGTGSFKDTLVNNFYFYVSDFAGKFGLMNTLILLGGTMIFFTLLKTSCYFGSNAVMVPISTGIVRELRCRIYNKILSLPIGFFSEERKGDIILHHRLYLHPYQGPHPYCDVFCLPYFPEPGHDGFHHPLHSGVRVDHGGHRQAA